MNNFFNNFNKFRENRRAVGFSKLGFWVVFFGIIFLIIAFSSNKNSSLMPTDGNKKEQKEIKNEINSYNFEYNYNGQKYMGTYTKNEIEIIGDDISFYIKDNEIFTSKKESVVPDYEYLDIHNLQKKIKDLEADSTTKYKDGKLEYTYNLNNLTIKYIDNADNTFRAIINDLDSDLEIYYYNINEAVLNIDGQIYKYRYNREDNYEY